MTKLQETCRALGRRLERFVGRKPKPKRLELRLVPYYPDGDKLCREGWVIAKEEDHNRMIGFVFLERLETPNLEKAL